MGQGFVDVVEIDAAIFVIVMDRLQTGDVLQERGSGQTAEHDHRVSPLELLMKRKGLALGIEGGDIG
jgi:hypothetical protein